MTNAYIAFVGQTREFLAASSSHRDLIKYMASIVDHVYVAYTVWDESYSTLYDYDCFFQHNINSDELLKQFADLNCDNCSIRVNVHSTKLAAEEMTAVFGPKYDEEYFERFLPVCYLHEKALDTMFMLETAEHIQFDYVILTRPDLRFKSDQPPIINLQYIAPQSVYYTDGPIPKNTDRFFGKRSDIKLTTYHDMLAIMGRKAFIAYGLAYQFIAAGKVSGVKQPLARPSLHRWMNTYLKQYDVDFGSLAQCTNYEYDIVRPKLDNEPEQYPLTTEGVARRAKRWTEHSVWSCDGTQAEVEKLRVKIEATLTSLGVKFTIIE